MSRAKTQAASDLTQGSIWKGMLQFFLPIMLGTLLQQLYSTVDSIILGRFVGKTALGAVGGSNTAIINLLVGFFVGLASGASVIIAQHYGAKEDRLVRRGVYTAFLLSVAIGAFLTAAGIATAQLLLTALGTPDDLMQYSMDYLQWYYAGMIPSMIYNMGSGILRAVGDSKRPLLFLVVCTLVNTVLDLFFVGVLRMEVKGAAIATSLSQLICAVLVIYTLRRRGDSCRLVMEKHSFDRALLGRMVAIGLPAGIQSTLYSITNVFVQKAVNSLGTDTVAAWSAFWKLDGIFWPVSGAIGIAVMTFVGQNYGARKPERIYGSIRVGAALHIGFSVLFAAFLYLARGPVLRLFCTDEYVVSQGLEIVTYIVLGYLTVFPTEVFSSAMRGTGNAVRPTLLTLLGICVLRMALLFTVTFPHTTNLTIAICYPITWAASSLLFVLYYKFGKWMPAYGGQAA